MIGRAERKRKRDKEKNYYREEREGVKLQEEGERHRGGERKVEEKERKRDT